MWYGFKNIFLEAGLNIRERLTHFMTRNINVSMERIDIISDEHFLQIRGLNFEVNTKMSFVLVSKFRPCF